MSEPEDKLNQLQTRLDNLAKYEAAFKREIADIRRDIAKLKGAAEVEKPLSDPAGRPPIRDKEQKPGKGHPEIPPQPEIEKEIPPEFEPSSIPIPEKGSSNLEQFVGKYLISIIGVLVTVLGVGIGAKYAIDNNLISPLLRIVFGYAVGLGLSGAAVHLKPKYHTFSSVLLSGGMAIMYFITYFAYSYYALMSQSSAFALMVIFTVFTVVAAIVYDRQVIAHIGLVGAYAVPFLLSEDTGRVEILFSYMAIINVGILAISVRKYWKYLFYSSFIFTWLIYAAWHLDIYSHAKHLGLSLTFLSIFFAIFYLTFIAYKLVHKKPFNIENVALVLQNSFLYFGFGHTALSGASTEGYRGLFTLINAFIHFFVAAVIHKYKLGDKNAFYLVTVLVLTFLTIAVPVQFDGNWITILWMAEAVFLFVIGRTKKIPLFEYCSFPLMMFACVSLFVEWEKAYWQFPHASGNAAFPILNKEFVSSFFVAVAFGAIFLIDRDRRFRSKVYEPIYQVARAMIPAAFLIVLYNTFRIEIGTYYHYRAFQTELTLTPEFKNDPRTYFWDSSLRLFNYIWQINYTLLFLTILSWINIRKFRSWVFGYINLGLLVPAMFVFISVGLIILGELQENYLGQVDADQFPRGIYHITIRYISFAFLATAIGACYWYIKQEFLTKIIPAKHLLILFELALCFTIWVILSNELITWTEILKIGESYKFGLSILWGSFAVSLIVIGIVRRKKHLRIFAMALFAVTITKLFLYDIAELETIPKTIAFVSVGILLLIASYLYNQYTKQILDEDWIEESTQP